MTEYKHTHYFVQQTEAEQVCTEIMFNRADNLYHFVNITKGYICPCGFKTVEEALADMEQHKKDGIISDYKSKTVFTNDKMPSIALYSEVPFEDIERETASLTTLPEEIKEEIDKALMVFLDADKGIRNKCLMRATKERIKLYYQATTVLGWLFGKPQKVSFLSRVAFEKKLCIINNQWDVCRQEHKGCDILTLWEDFIPRYNDVLLQTKVETQFGACESKVAYAIDTFQLAALLYAQECAEDGEQS